MKEEYIEMRKTGQFRIEWFYKYYIQEFEKLKEEKGYQVFLSFEMFYHIFRGYLQQVGEEVLSYLDKIFGLHILTGKNGEFIKVID